MKKLIAKLQSAYPSIVFIAGDIARWSPKRQEITYRHEENREAIWGLLHELSHGILKHEAYTTDMDLLQKELAAWKHAQELAITYHLEINNEHIETCLDTYRDWLHKRSTCPECTSQGLQQSKRLYICFNCQTTWRVTERRFCRPYRLKKPYTA